MTKVLFKQHCHYKTYVCAIHDADTSFPQEEQRTCLYYTCIFQLPCVSIPLQANLPTKADLCVKLLSKMAAVAKFQGLDLSWPGFANSLNTLSICGMSLKRLCCVAKSAQ
jgi:hypothetical protein